MQQVVCPVLVGRDEEARRLWAALAAAEAGRGSAVFLTGEAGIGKSRLVRETVRAAAERGLTVLVGRAVAGGVPTPFRPFAEALTSAGRTGRLPASAELDPFRPVLGRLVPEWRQPRGTPGEESLVFLGEAVLRLLRVLAAQAGCVLVLEDMHWADRETLGLLEYLADNLAAERLLCVATLRDEGGEASALTSALGARGSAAVFPLGRLDPRAMADMARACLDAADLPDAVHAVVAERAEGIPFLVEEILAGLVGEGALTERDGRWRVADLAAPGVPATFADAVRRRLDTVGTESRYVIGAAAVLGCRFDWELLGPVTGLVGAAVVAALRDGVGLQLITQGALALTATLDLQIAAGLNKQFRADEAWQAARRSADASRRFHLATLPMALIFMATAHAIRGEERDMEARIAEAVALAPADQDVLGCAWGHCRATFSLLAADLGEAHARMATGAGLLLSSPATIAPPFLGLWPLLGALLDRDAEDAAARVRAAHGTRHLVVAALLGYAGAIRAGRQGRPGDAEAAFAAADRQMGPLVAWYQQYARRVVAEAALSDAWGEPVAWLREATAYFAARGDDQVAAACRGLLRGAGAPVPRHRTGDGELPGRLRALGVTEREASVLRLAAQGLGNREIAERMFLSPRTVEKHVASLLAKTGLRRAQLSGYSAGLDG